MEQNTAAADFRWTEESLLYVETSQVLLVD